VQYLLFIATAELPVNRITCHKTNKH